LLASFYCPSHRSQRPEPTIAMLDKHATRTLGSRNLLLFFVSALGRGSQFVADSSRSRHEQ
jgi:hypothetical protein